jgi:hypothetical protein
MQAAEGEAGMRFSSFPAIAAVSLMVAACSSQTPGNEGASSAASGNAAPPDDATNDQPAFESKVKGLKIVAASTIPSHRDDNAEDAQLCNSHFQSAKSDAAKAIEKQGWHVTGEEAAGGYTIVSFVGGAEPGTSGSCLLDQGNIAFYRDGALRAIAYAAKGAQASIGSIRSLEGQGVRISDGDFLPQPVADIEFAKDGAIAITTLAASEKLCNGEATVPNIYGLPINRASATLRKAGWTPNPPAGEERDERAEEMGTNGLPEAADCSGTGFGYCSFSYKGKAGTLSVTTVGEDEWPGVVGYDVACH